MCIYAGRITRKEVVHKKYFTGKIFLDGGRQPTLWLDNGDVVEVTWEEYDHYRVGQYVRINQVLEHLLAVVIAILFLVGVFFLLNYAAWHW